jgi:hypothetical protein
MKKILDHYPIPDSHRLRETDKMLVQEIEVPPPVTPERIAEARRLIDAGKGWKLVPVKSHHVGQKAGDAMHEGDGPGMSCWGFYRPRKLRPLKKARQHD